MTLRKSVLMILLAALLSPVSVAQFAGSGGMGGFGGNGGFGGLGAQGPPIRGSGKAQWRPWLNASGVYNDNPLYFNEQGEVVTSQDTRGIGGGWGLSVRKSLEKTSIIGSYMGSVTTGTGKSGISGVNQVLAIGASHRFNQHIYGSIQQLLGSTLGGYGVGSGFAGIGSGLGGFSPLQGNVQGGLPGLGDPSLNGFVDEEVFANRVKFSGTFASLGYQLSMRSSVSASGGAQFTKRDQNTLADSNSYFGGASYNYAIDRNTQIGAGYSWGTFKYPQRFGNNVVQSLGISLGRRLSERATISGSAGVSQFDSEFVGTVEVDPELAELLGITATTSVQKAKRTTFSGGISASYRTDIANLYITAMRGMVPGNGLLYGGVRDMIAAGAAGSLFDSKLSLGLNASISRTSGVIQREVQLRYQTSVGIGYNLGAQIFLTVGGGLRWQRVSQSGPFLPSKFASIGIGWSPTGYPLFF